MVPVTVAPMAYQSPCARCRSSAPCAYEDVQLAPKVDGRVLRTLKDLGDAVAGRGATELDPTDYKLAIGQARRLSRRSCGS